MENLEVIIQCCLQNNPKTQRALYEHYFGYCLKTVFRYIYHYDKAVDVVNDGFIKIFRNLDKFQYSKEKNIEMMLMGWMRMIMINTAIDYLRKNNFSPEIGNLPDAIWKHEDESSRSDQALLYKELLLEIKKLPPAYRTVFNMFVIDGFTHQEIATQLGISVGTSKSNLSKARANLQKILIDIDKQTSACSI